jgi:hypothetical protein
MAFLIAAVAWYKRLGIKIERQMTDNGSCCRPAPIIRSPGRRVFP